VGVTVHALRGLLDLGDRHDVDVQLDGLSGGDLARMFRRPEWGESHVAIAVNGRKLRDDEVERALEPGDDVVLTPAMHVILAPLVPFILTALAGAALSYVYSLLVPAPRLKSPERGDESSATYSWDGIQTNTGPGFPIPIVFGRHKLGGQVIEKEVRASDSTELLYLVIALAVGRCQEIGGYTGFASGEVDLLGGRGNYSGRGLLPADIKVNGVALDNVNPKPGAFAWLRMGTPRQQVISGAARGTPNTIAARAQLNDQFNRAVVEVNDSSPIAGISITIDFPNGLYDTIANQGVSMVANFSLWWRPQGTTSWNILNFEQIAKGRPIYNPLAQTFEYELPRGTVGPIEILCIREFAHGNGQDLMRVRHVVYYVDAFFAYPGLCYMALDLEAGERFAGDDPQVTAILKARKVRLVGVAGEVAPGVTIDAYAWELPGSADPFFNIWTYPPGQNPGWIALTFAMMREGLNKSPAQINFQDFRNLADYCDMTVNGGPRYTCNIVIDKQQSAWEWLQKILATARAVPYLDGNTLRVKYEFAAAHGRGLNVVPAKTTYTQVFTSTNVEDFSVHFFNRRKRATVLEGEFVDENLDFERNSIPIEDPDSLLNRQDQIDALPFQKQPMSLIGETRATQVKRTLLFAHRANSRIPSRVQMTVGPEALNAELGDLVGVNHVFLQPYDEQSYSYRTKNAVSGVPQIVLDHDVTLLPLKTYNVVFKRPDEFRLELTITDPPGFYPEGVAINLSADATYEVGAPVAFGVATKVQKGYVVASITLAQNLKRKVTLIDHVPSIHDEPLEDELGSEEAPAPYSRSSDHLIESTVEVFEVKATRQPDGSYVISWFLEDAGKGRRRARVFLRAAGGSYPWDLVGETFTTDARVRILSPGQSYEVRVMLETADGAVGPIGDTPDLTFTAEEFAPHPAPRVHHLEAIPLQRGGLLRCAPVIDDQVQYYEWRKGAGWVGGQVIAKELKAEYFWRDAPPGVHQVMGRARAKNGLYSDSTWTTQLLVLPPDGTTIVAASGVDDLGALPAGLVDLTWDPATHQLRIADGKLSGSWVSPIYDLGFIGRVLWVAILEAYQLDELLPEEATWNGYSGEALWRTVAAREPSPAAPGINFDLMPADLGTMLPADLPKDLLGRGWSSQIGEWTRARLEIDYDSTGSGAWSGYLPITMERRTARRFRLRLSMHRAHLRTQIYVTQLERQVLV